MKPDFLIILLYIVFTGCNKLSSVPAPTTSITGTTVFNNDANSIGLVTGLYSDMSGSLPAQAGTFSSLSLWPGLSADELTLWNGIPAMQALAYYENRLDPGGPGSEYWETLYKPVSICNGAIDGLMGSANLTPAVKQQLLGEAHFVRAFVYFYLVNLYGPIPLPVTTNSQTNITIAQSSVDAVYRQIMADLQYAAGALSPIYLDGSLLNPSVDRVRPTRWAALALLARTALYTSDWPHAEKYADTVISNTGDFALSPLDTVFLKASLGNREAIWQLQPTITGVNTEEAAVFVLPAAGPPNNGLGFGVYLSNSLLSAFEPGDLRRSHWINSVTAGGVTYDYPYKYKIATLNAPIEEYPTLLRLAEVYLIRAEARAEQNDLAGAAADLNLIRTRAGLGSATAPTQAQLLTAILHERRVELFTELGHRWLDLKRTHSVDSVMAVATPLKGGTWNSEQQLYPVPSRELGLDPNLRQNPGF